MKKLLSALGALILMIFVANAYSRIITVGEGVEYDYQTITEAARAAQPDDVILVADGTYSEATGENFPIDLGSSITLKSAISGSLPLIESNSGQTILQVYGENICIEELEFAGNYEAQLSRYCISIVYNSNVEIRKCVIIRNPGGGVYCWSNSTVSFSDCVIADNGKGLWSSASYGGGVLGSMDGEGSHMTFRNCLIANNTAYSYGTFAYAEGGGVHVGNGIATFINCIFANNSANSTGVLAMGDRAYAWAWGGGVCNGGTFINCSFINNTVYAIYEALFGNWKDGDYRGGAIYGSGEIINCIIDTSMYGDITARYSDIIGGWEGEGNIDTEPRFVDPQNSNYRLLDSSPCIDAGDPDPQWNDACLPPGKGTERNDMGAYGGPYNCGWQEAGWPLLWFRFDYWHQEWDFAGTVAAFDEPNAKWDLKRLGISPAGSANCFSYWYSPEIIVEKGNAYRARWKVSSSLSDSDQALDFRLRANQLGNWRFWTTGVVSLNDAAPTTQTKTYDLILLPEMESATDKIVLSFDLMSFDPANDLQSWLYLDEVRLDEVTLASIIPAVVGKYYSFDSDSEGWQFQGTIGDFDEPVPIVEPGRIGLSPNGSPYCFSYWLSPEIPVGKDRIYLVSWQVSSSVSDPDQVVDFRLRCNQTSNMRAWDTGTLFSLSNAYPTGMEPKTYELIIFPQMSIPSDTVRLSFDIMSFDGSNDLNSYIYLEDVTVQEYLIQP
jgi:hypothetical protein